MNSGGETIDVEDYLRVVRVQIDALHCSIDQALVVVPDQYRETVRIRWEEETALPIRRVHVLSGSGGPRAWFTSWDPSQGYYWRRQRAWLIDALGRSQADVGSIDDATDRILSHLEDPRPSGPVEFNVRGLVMGYVQSGKTANFCALIAKAADLGYKLVIILSGVHNSLRQQTQRRINRALGLGDDRAGVPQPEPGRWWISLTGENLHGDFRPGTIDANVLQGNERVVLVVKKNASVLRRLTAWMGNHAPASLPVLIIDDEADQGSINTGGNRPPLEEEADLGADDVDDPNARDELDPSVINSLVRGLTAAFHRVSYVAYTATPFANILINHLAVDREVFEDLYPRDFIVALPCPNGYNGAERLFGREELPGDTAAVLGLDVIGFVPDHEAAMLSPSGRDLPSFVPQVTASLHEAILDFVLAIVGRHERTRRDSAATMLIHTHYRKHVQNQLGPLIREHMEQLRQTWRYDRDRIRPILSERWETRFRPLITSLNLQLDCRFEELEVFLDQLFRDPIPVIVLNSDSDFELDYESDPTLKAVIVGGNRLSRGLTLEGLLVSYFVRRSDYYDALMQMGRWFGFREGYVDLTRIWTTEELATRFHDLALAEEELRREIERYEREKLTPVDFGPRIRSHPAMMITARNKMGSARFVSQNYSGHLLQTTAFRLEDTDWLHANIDATARLLARLGAPSHRALGHDLPTWKGISWQDIDQYLSQYRFDPRATHEGAAIRQYLQAQVRLGELTDWSVSVRGRTTPRDASLGEEPALAVSGHPCLRISRTRLRNSPHSIGSLVEPATPAKVPGSGDEEVDLTLEQVAAARATTEAGAEYPRELRRERPKTDGLLLIYPISPYSRPLRQNGNRMPLFEDPDGACTVVGIALVFPASDSAATIDYVVGSVGSPPDID